MAEDVLEAPVEAGNPSEAEPTPNAAPAASEPPKDQPLAAGGESDKKDKAPADWPDDWRSKLAGEDKDTLKAVERYKSPVEVAKALREAQKKLSEGMKRPELPKDADEEAIAAYRKELGVPEKPEGYLENLPGGLVIGEADKETATSFANAAHAANIPPEYAGQMIDWYYKQQEEVVAAEVQKVKEFRAASEDALRAEWGAEFRSEQNSIKSFLQALPDTEDGTPMWSVIAGSRMDNGALLGDHPDFLRWVATLAREKNPAGFVSPGAGTSQVDSVNTEIAEIEALMRENRPAYDKDDKKQARYLQLLAAREKLSSR